ncbi:MAG: rhodanese-like domain-containing protein [Proteobacteria bacterium]|nr:rhodanese-like domain-containing protein [Pseudomonadota bacterium]
MASRVTAVPAAPSPEAQAHFERTLRFETDCWDVHQGLAEGADFVVLDVRSPEAYALGHVPGATSLPQAKIIGSRMATYPPGTVFVTYCAGPHCNGAQRAAIRLAQLGLPVKIMLGGMTGWHDEGFAVAVGPAA